MLLRRFYVQENVKGKTFLFFFFSYSESNAKLIRSLIHSTRTEAEENTRAEDGDLAFAGQRPQPETCRDGCSDRGIVYFLLGWSSQVFHPFNSSIRGSKR